MDDDRTTPQPDGDLAALSTVHSFEPGAERCFKCGAAIEWVEDNPRAPCPGGPTPSADAHALVAKAATYWEHVRRFDAAHRKYIDAERARREAPELTDLALYGSSFVKDGERIDPGDVVLAPDCDRVEGAAVAPETWPPKRWLVDPVVPGWVERDDPANYIETEPRPIDEGLVVIRDWTPLPKILGWSGQRKPDEWPRLTPGAMVWLDESSPVKPDEWIFLLDGVVTVAGGDLPADEHRADEVWLPEPDDRPEQVAAALTSWLDLATANGWPADEKVLQALVDAVERYRCYRGGR